MTFKKLPKANPDDPQIYARIDDDGKCRLTCTEDYLELKEWLSAGNTPMPCEQNETT
jgi:hypothetical protein